MPEKCQSSRSTQQGDAAPVSARPAQPSLDSQGPLHRLRALQQTLGNQGMRHRLQAKLTVNQPGDVYEQEAERVAEAVTSQSRTELAPAISGSFAASPAAVQRKCAACAEEE